MGRHIARIVSGIARQIKQMARTDAQFFTFDSHAYIKCRRHVFKTNHLTIQQVHIICQEHTMGRHIARIMSGMARQIRKMVRTTPRSCETCVCYYMSVLH
jgi:hypothetical protein